MHPPNHVNPYGLTGYMVLQVRGGVCGWVGGDRHNQLPTLLLPSNPTPLES